MMFLRRRFESCFGFSPARSTAWNSLYQRIVDMTLTRLAVSFHDAAREETSFYSEAARSNSAKEILELRKKFPLVLEEVRRTKSAFWTARRLAERAGFGVRQKYSDYLQFSAETAW